MSPRLALVHERFTELAGSERVVEQLHALWPRASVHAPIVDPAALPEGLREAALYDSGLQRLYRGDGRYAHLLPLLPAVLKHLPLPEVDAVVVSHHAFASRIALTQEAPVVAYVHTPARWIWESDMRRGEVGGRLGSAALTAFAATQRSPDRRAAGRLAGVIANSAAVADRIARYWRREAVVVHPPVDIDYYHPDPAVPREDFLLLAGRLVPYKRPEVAVLAAARVGLPLVVTGTGRARAALEALDAPGVTFLGRVDDATLRDLYRRCQALLMPGEEDFGIVPVEAAACGAPVLALAAGGALETVRPGETGLLVEATGHAAAVDGFSVAIRQLENLQLDPATIRRHAESFSRERFRAGVARACSELTGLALEPALIPA